MNSEKQYLKLYHTDGTSLFIRPSRYQEIKQELITFLETEKGLCTKSFAKRVMFSQEIKANNQVEGYGDDVELIKRTIERTKGIQNKQQRQRILNLYHGYQYILKEPSIDKDNLKQLYAILSKGLLEKADAIRMGEYYRHGPVYILKQGRLDLEPYQGVYYQKIEKYMGYYFDFLETCFSQSKKRTNPMDITEEYIKSQIMHYYFVYVHPYFDVNGRTSRTLAMWYLLHTRAYPYIIFNRGIGFKGSEYDKAIEDIRRFNDLSFFIDYMLTTVKVELEKEYVMQLEATFANAHLTALDYQTLLYFLTMRGQKTVLDFATMYNRFNDKKRTKEIYENMIISLLDKGVLEKQSSTQKQMPNGVHNFYLTIRNKKEIDVDKVKRLEL